MPSALIPAGHGYRAMLLAEQLAHQRAVHPGPLVLGVAPLKPPPPATDRDRTVSRRSKPSSRTALMGEQPNPWDLLQPQDAMSRQSATSVTIWEVPPPVKLPTWHCPRPGSRAKVRTPVRSGWYFNDGSTEASAPASTPPTYPTQTLPTLPTRIH